MHRVSQVSRFIKEVDDWVSACRSVDMTGLVCRGRSKKSWRECMNDGIKLLGLQLELEIFKDMQRDIILLLGNHLTLAQHGRNRRFHNKW